LPLEGFVQALLVAGIVQALPVEGLVQLLSLQVEGIVQAFPSVRFWGEVKIALFVSHDHLLQSPSSWSLSLSSSSSPSPSSSSLSSPPSSSS
jgi:hypothetical protein